LYFMLPLPPRSTLFPYTTLFRSLVKRPGFVTSPRDGDAVVGPLLSAEGMLTADAPVDLDGLRVFDDGWAALADLHTFTQNTARRDRKSTRLNSSHVKISYAVFCL